MATLVLFEDDAYRHFLPLVYWRGMMGLRAGHKLLLDNVAYTQRMHVGGVWCRNWIEDLLSERFQVPANKPADHNTILLNARWLMREPVAFASAPCIASCGDAIAYIACDEKLAAAVTPELLLDPDALARLREDWPTIEIEADLVRHPWDLVARNSAMLAHHWSGDDRGATGSVSSSAYLMNPDHIHVGERSRIRPTAVIDAQPGPVFISNDTTVDVHCYIEGPCYIGPGCTIKPHTAIRGGTTVGSMCVVGGEISRAIMAGMTNKQHDGFLGDTYVGGWVNLAAGMTTANHKTTFGEVTVQLGDAKIATGRDDIGSVIGDFARLAINELLQAGAVIGFGAMVASGGWAPKHVRSLSWHTTAGESAVDVERLLDTARRMAVGRREQLSSREAEMIRRIPSLIERYGV